MAAKRKRHDEGLLARSVARVLGGERPAAVAEQAGIPYSTLMTRVTWKKRGQEPVTSATRKKRRKATTRAALEAEQQAAEPPTELPAAAEADILAWMVRLQRAAICVRRRDVLALANRVLVLLGGEPELGAVWFTRFRERHPEITGHGTNLVVDDEAAATVTAEFEARRQQPAAIWAAIVDPPLPSAGRPVLSEDVSGLEPMAVVSMRPAADEDEAVTPSERAVALLQTEYVASLSSEDLAEAFDVVLDPIKARVLLVLERGALRDQWVAQQVRKKRRAVQQPSTATAQVASTVDEPTPTRAVHAAGTEPATSPTQII